MADQLRKNDDRRSDDRRSDDSESRKGLKKDTDKRRELSKNDLSGARGGAGGTVTKKPSTPTTSPTKKQQWK